MIVLEGLETEEGHGTSCYSERMLAVSINVSGERQEAGSSVTRLLLHSRHEINCAWFQYSFFFFYKRKILSLVGKRPSSDPNPLLGHSSISEADCFPASRNHPPDLVIRLSSFSLRMPCLGVSWWLKSLSNVFDIFLKIKPAIRMILSPKCLSCIESVYHTADEPYCLPCSLLDRFIPFECSSTYIWAWWEDSPQLNKSLSGNLFLLLTHKAQIAPVKMFPKYHLISCHIISTPQAESEFLFISFIFPDQSCFSSHAYMCVASSSF